MYRKAVFPVRPGGDNMVFIKHWRHVRHIQGWLEFDEAMYLFESAKKIKLNGVILEIGSYKGRSTVALALGSKEGSNIPVYTIDTFCHFHPENGTAAPTEFFNDFLANINNSGVSDIVHPIAKASDEAAKDWNLPIAFLFIDGDHSYEQVKKDYYNYSKFIVKGGVVAFHDVAYFDGVKKLVGEVRGNLPSATIKELCPHVLKNICAWVIE